MDFTADLSLFTADFGADAIIGGVAVRGIFDANYTEIFDGLVAGTGPRFLCESAAIPNLKIGDALSVNATAYTVAAIDPDGTGMSALHLETA